MASDSPPAQPSRPILPGQPTLVVGRIVAYLGFRSEEFRYAGTYRVRSYTNCFDIDCGPLCDRFLYYLEPQDPAACGLDPGFGIAAHGVAALTPADAPSIDVRNPS
ncbi:MAG: hypothetical protein AUG49_13075 [Catenulispora sp. 13_1_20CM_3_70_7]|nr:MAG: hypothetical protein AUG49_13075 [Catenulispora sp. 13_1_20CM_3_70_7]